MTTWFYADRGQQFGPVTDAELRSLLAAGTISPTTLVWREGMTDWLAVHSIPDLAAPATAPIPHAIQASLSYASPSPQVAGDIGQNAGMRMLLPVGRSGWAIASGYLGLLSILLLPAPFAVITGIIAVVHITRNPRVHGMGRAIFGIVMGLFGCALFVLFIIGSIVG